jgi:glycosyltransferase involved in cell wall biosynthesis
MISLARELFSVPARLRYRRALASGDFLAPCDECVVNYGEALEGKKLVAGGKVKLLHLRARWPERSPFNLLYLVSSAPPMFAGELVRWAKRCGAKFVLNQNGIGFPAWAGWRTWDVNRPMAALLRQADHVIYQSEFCRRSADEWLQPADCLWSVLHNPVDTTVFCPSPAPPSPRDAWRLLAAGTHYQPFRVLGALETARVLLDAGHRVQLTVAGELRWTDADAQVHAAIARLRLAEHVTLRPAFSQEEAVGLYQSAHVLLHLKYHDPCPTVVVEALACGVPVVGSRSGGLPELAGDEGGELLQVPLDWWRAGYPPARRCAAAIGRILREWPQRSAAARARAERLFRKEAWLEAHAQIFDRLINDPEEQAVCRVAHGSALSA